MKATVEELKKNQVLLKVEVPIDNVKASIGKAYRRISEKINIQGFRRGKIPPRIIDAHIGKGPVLQEALQEMLPHYYVEAIKTTGVKPIAKPEIEVVQIKEDEPLLFNAKVEVKPKVELGDYEKIEVKKKTVNVSKEDVDQQLESLQKRFARLEAVKGRSIKKGDFVLINYEGKVGGKVYDGGSVQDYFLEVGSNIFPPEFEEKLVGARTGEILDIVVDVPKLYYQTEIAGNRVNYKVLVKEIKQKVLPELNDKFAKETSEFESLNDLRADLKKNIRKLKEKEAEAQVKIDILDQLANISKVEVPEVMVEERVTEKIEDLKERLKIAGLNWEDYLEQAKTAEEDLKKSLREDAEKNTKKRLALEALAEKEGLEVSPEELDNEIRITAQREGKSFGELKKDAEDKGYLDAFKEDILAKKALDLLPEKVKIIKDIDKDKVKKEEKTKEKEAKKSAK